MAGRTTTRRLPLPLRLLRWVVVALLWVLVIPALLINGTAGMALGGLAHDTDAWRPDDPLPTSTYLAMWLISGAVIVLFAAIAYRRAEAWSEWSRTGLVRANVVLFALGLGCLAAAIAGVETVSDPLRTVAVYAGIVGWLLLGAMAVTHALLGNRGRAGLVAAALVGWGVLAFVSHGTALALVQILVAALGVSAIAEYLLWLSGRFGFSMRKAIKGSGGSPETDAARARTA
jgi:hypothetical protein